MLSEAEIVRLLVGWPGLSAAERNAQILSAARERGYLDDPSNLERAIRFLEDGNALYARAANPLLVVRLDDPRYGAGPGTVIAHVGTVAEFNALATDRDGARDARLRLWRGDSPIGARVTVAGSSSEPA